MDAGRLHRGSQFYSVLTVPGGGGNNTADGDSKRRSGIGHAGGMQ